MLTFAIAVQPMLPSWLQAPQWVFALNDGVQHFIRLHQAAGLFVIISAEEAGIPLPVPGEVAILWAGYLTRIHQLGYVQAFAVVVAGATLGSTFLFSVSRALGHRFLVRYGPYVGLEARRLERAENAFTRWGPWGIVVGRLIPGFRIVMSAFAGAFNVPYAVFVPSVLASAMLWALVFLALGRYFGPRTIALFQLLPAHLLPLLLLLAILALIVLLARLRSRGRRPVASSPAPANIR